MILWLLLVCFIGENVPLAVVSICNNAPLNFVMYSKVN
jgi:hypothetical protein